MRLSFEETFWLMLIWLIFIIIILQHTSFYFSNRVRLIAIYFSGLQNFYGYSSRPKQCFGLDCLDSSSKPVEFVQSAPATIVISITRVLYCFFQDFQFLQIFSKLLAFIQSAPSTIVFFFLGGGVHWRDASIFLPFRFLSFPFCGRPEQQHLQNILGIFVNYLVLCFGRD